MVGDTDLGVLDLNETKLDPCSVQLYTITLQFKYILESRNKSVHKGTFIHKIYC